MKANRIVLLFALLAIAITGLYLVRTRGHRLFGTKIAALGSVKTCTIVLGGLGAAAPPLPDYNDPVPCKNYFGRDWKITSISCFADQGSAVATAVLFDGSNTSILTGGPVVCSGALRMLLGNNAGLGAHVTHSFYGTENTKDNRDDGGVCPSDPCLVKVLIGSLDHTAKCIMVKITGTTVMASLPHSSRRF